MGLQVEQVSPGGRVQLQVSWSLLAMVVLEAVVPGDVVVQWLVARVASRVGRVAGAEAVEEDESERHHRPRLVASYQRWGLVEPMGV